jgi:hypothetical protein
MLVERARLYRLLLARICLRSHTTSRRGKASQAVTNMSWYPVVAKVAALAAILYCTVLGLTAAGLKLSFHPIEDPAAG